MIPSLIVLARTRIYPVLRVGVAAIGLVWSVAWMLERSPLIPTDPFDGAQTWLVEHPFLVAAAVAVLALVSHRLPRLGSQPAVVGAA